MMRDEQVAFHEAGHATAAFLLNGKLGPVTIVPGEGFGGCAFASPGHGATRFSGGVVDLGAGQGHSRHNHPGAEEIIFVISGHGEQMVEDPDGKPVVQKVGPGCTVYVPESRFHSTLNTGDGPMQLFVVYSPAGPELALRDLPDFRLVPPGGV